jgi:SAM-dependent methyltransferase
MVLYFPNATACVAIIRTHHLPTPITTVSMAEPCKDLSNGWEAMAKDYHNQRRWQIGADVIQTFTQDLQAGQSVLDLGCGCGGPHIQQLLDRSIDVYAIDAAPTMIAQFRQRFPTAKACCEAAEHSNFYQMKFDAMLLIGFIFLLAADTQRHLLTSLALSLHQGGRILFSSPAQVCQWPDVSTGLMSISLGKAAYIAIFRQLDMTLRDEYTDAGGNHYFCFVKS